MYNNRPSIQETLISIAFSFAERSTCSRGHNGAVIADSKGVILSTGYNGSPSGFQHCDHECNCGVLTDIHYESCPMNIENRCTTAIHAEANAVYFAARNGVRIQGAIMYCTSAPCRKCAEAIIQSGISEVYYGQLYRSTEGIDLLTSAGIKVAKHESNNDL